MEAFQSSEHPLVRHLGNVGPLSDGAKQALAKMPMQVASLKADEEIIREGDCPTQCFVILEGFVINYKGTGGGRRQILAQYLPGDMPDVQSLHLAYLDSSFGSITPCRIGFIQHDALRAVCQDHPEVTTALWRWTLIMAAIYREWVLNVGQRGAKARVAHLLCETLVRMRAVGLAQDNSCEFAFTQDEFADANGMSTVHVNRMLQLLRNQKLIHLNDRHFIALDWEKLKREGDFDPSYLHLRDPKDVAT
jgi:CRP-like cAMP-binding protein